MASVIKNVWGATIVSQEIERGDIIVYETGIYKAVVVSVRASKCFFSSIYWSGKIVLINSDIDLENARFWTFEFRVFDS